MSWLELDDRILEHPKFIRAVKLAGSEAVHLWLGLRAYCGQLLTDGFIPEDMFDEVRGPTNAKKRAAAFEALKAVKLLDPAEGGVQMHDYLKWSKSRDQIERERVMARDRKARSRGSHGVTDTVTPNVTDDVTVAVTPESVTRPHARGRAPLLSTPLHSSPEIPPHSPLDGDGDDPSKKKLDPYWDPGPGVFIGTGIPDWAQLPLLQRYRAGHCAKGAKRTEAKWLEAFAWWVTQEWQRVDRRPTPPASVAEPEDDGAEARRKAAREARVITQRATQATHQRQLAERQGAAMAHPDDHPRSVAELVKGIGT